MEKIFVFIAYLINSVITIQLALVLFGINDKIKKGIIVALISGFADFFVREVIVPYFNLFDYLHFFTGVIILILSCYYILSLTIGGSVSISILTYVLSGIGEFIVILILMLIFGMDFFDSIKNNQLLVTFYAVLGQFTLLIPLFILRLKKIKFINFSINR